jgi:hypothetical protein
VVIAVFYVFDSLPAVACENSVGFLQMHARVFFCSDTRLDWISIGRTV